MLSSKLTIEGGTRHPWGHQAEVHLLAGVVQFEVHGQLTTDTRPGGVEGEPCYINGVHVTLVGNLDRKNRLAGYIKDICNTVLY